MTDPTNSRQILPSTVSSTTVAGPVTPSRARVSTACESCKRRKCKCTGGPPCESCLNANIQCVFDESQDKRRKVHSKRTIEDLTSTNENLILQVQVFRSLQKAIQNDTYHDAFEQIRQHAPLFDISETLRDQNPQTKDGEADSADTDHSFHESNFVDDTQLGHAFHQNRVLSPADHSMDLLPQAECSNHDVMELDPPASDAVVGSEMRRMQHERDHYKRIVTQLQDGTGAEAEDMFQRLRAFAQRNIFRDPQLPMRGEDVKTFGTARTLPEMSTSIRTPRRSWSERDGSGNGPLFATSPHAAQKSGTNNSTSSAQARASPPYQSGYAMGSTGMGLSQYITSAERLRHESGTYAGKESMRSK